MNRTDRFLRFPDGSSSAWGAPCGTISRYSCKQKRNSKMASRVFTVPNQLTFLRLGFLPFFIISIHYHRYDIALAVLIVAGLTDGLDGLLARSLNQKTVLGAYLDPIADKLLLSSSFLVLAFKKQLAWWLTIIVLSRDVLILIVAVVILLVSGYRR